MKIIYFGTPPFSADILRYLIEQGVSIAAIVTQPDQPQGRNLQLKAPAVKEVAPQFPIYQPEKASDASFLSVLSAHKADLFVVVAYGQILSQKLLDIPPLGCINVHASLLPKYRGAAPMQRCLMHGDVETGVSIQKMVFQLDAGDVIAEERISVPLEMTYGELEQKLCELSKPLLLSVLHRYEKGVPPGRVQDPLKVTLAPKIKAEETLIDWKRSALELHNLSRALSPRPGAWCWTEVNGGRKRLKILRTRCSSGQGDEPGHVLEFRQDRCIVACKEGSLQLLEVQPEGKKAMAVADWIRGCIPRPIFSVS